MDSGMTSSGMGRWKEMIRITSNNDGYYCTTGFAHHLYIISTVIILDTLTSKATRVIYTQM